MRWKYLGSSANIAYRKELIAKYQKAQADRHKK